MIQLFLNEKSLSGQFSSVEDFSKNGIAGVVAVLDEKKRLSVDTILYKSVSIADAKVTSDLTYSEILYGEIGRVDDGIRRYKVELAHLIDDPFWNEDSKQNMTDQYMSLGGESLNGSSIAEAESRKGILLSFPHQDYSEKILKIKKNDIEVTITNIWGQGQLIDVSYEKSIIPFKEYVIIKLDGQKLDFSRAVDGRVWDQLPRDLESSVFETFKIFCQLSWYEIPQNQGLGYKTYSKTKKNRHFFGAHEWDKGIKEFRVSGKFRCFGYAENGFFYLLLIDPQHLLGKM